MMSWSEARCRWFRRTSGGCGLAAAGKTSSPLLDLMAPGGRRCTATGSGDVKRMGAATVQSRDVGEGVVVAVAVMRTSEKAGSPLQVMRSDGDGATAMLMSNDHSCRVLAEAGMSTGEPALLLVLVNP
ncbi:hypothetical protein MLD38_003187 [Melastoma candidum]|uniref:Uncharacterized protein n=1 Tax=Melastoma candidum TaxID=119954 RepID=A0ACB9S685_9MYRT|nr:hypothetical protein MLD38_003187 [Melastoma candidum]